jgi:tetratricopeptide (TPR) repeat protein
MIKRHHTVLFIFLFVSGVYLLTISPAINWRDSPEFAHISYSLGIAHPAGFPVYALIAKLFTMLPFGSIAFKVNLFSLFSSAISIVLIYLISSDILTLLSGESEDDGHLYAASIISAAFLCINIICWQNSVIAEVYSFNMFFTLLLIYLLIRFLVTKSDAFLFSAAFLYGVSSGNHATVAFYLPALITFYFLVTKERRAAKFILVCTFFMLGFSVYLYLPLRSIADPAYDWSNPETFTQFLTHITDRKTSYSHFAGFKDFGTIIANIKKYLITLNKNLTPIGILLSAIGAIFMHKRNRSLFYLIFLILTANTLFFFDWNGGVQLPSYICYIIFISAGIYSVSKRLGNIRFISARLNPGKLFQYFVILMVIFLGVFNFSLIDRSNIYTGEDDFKKQFLKLPENSIVILSYLYFHNRYYQDILGLRRDVSVLGYGEILTPKLSPAISKDMSGDVMIAGHDLELTGTAKVNEFINMNINGGRRIFTEITSEFKGFERYIKYYDGMLFEFSKARIERLEKSDVDAISGNFNDIITRFIMAHDYKNDKEASFVYIENFINTIDYMLHYGYLDGVLYMVDTMQKVFGSDFRDDLLDNEKKNLKVLAGVAYIKKNDFSTAEKHFLQMIERDEHKYEAYNKLGFIYKHNKKFDLAAKYYGLAMEEAPYIMDNYIELGMIHEKNNEAKKAKNVYKRGMKYLYQDEKRVMNEKIKALRE